MAEEEVIKRKPSGKRNRAAGHDFERRVAELFRNIGFLDTVTSRSESKSRDDQGIDLINKDEGTVGRLPYNVQCKNTNAAVNYYQVLGKMPTVPGVINVILHKFTERKNNTFFPRGHYAILSMHDFIQMAERLRVLELAQKDKGNESID